MASVAVAAEPWADRRRRALELRSRYGFASEVLDFYAVLLTVQETAFREALAASPPPESLAAYVSEVVVPRVIDVSVAAGPNRLQHDLIDCLERERVSDIVARWIRGEPQSIAERYLARASTAPVLEALGAEVKAACAGPRDALHCPECRGTPQLSYAAPAPENLAAGPRRLLCARCGADWGFARMTCAGCGEDSSSKLMIFSEQGTTSGERGSIVRGLAGALTNGHSSAVFPHMRVEACESCRQYLLSVDLATEPDAVPVVDELAAIPLDLFARERGFSKITTNLMGF
jgi:FdhE protein